MEKTINLVLGGGGASGLASIGVILELIENNYNISCITGTSAGAICGALYACLCEQTNDIEQIKSGLYDAIYSDLTKFKDSNWLSFISFYAHKLFLSGDYHLFGLYKGDYMVNFIANKTNNMTFKDLTKVKLAITATEPTTGTLVMFSKETTPNIRIADAVVASSSIQGIFKPRAFNANDIIDGFFDDNNIQLPLMKIKYDHPLKEKINNNTKVYLQDGGNLGNTRLDIAVNICDDVDNTQLIGVTYTYDDDIKKMKQANSILAQTISIMMNAADKIILKYVALKSKYSNAIVLSPDTKVGTTEFDLTDEQKDELIESGRIEVRKNIINL